MKAKPFLRIGALSLCVAITAARAEQVIFSEVHYNPKTGDPEFIEILNNTSTPFDIGKWYFSDGVDYVFPDFNPADTDAHILRPFERILVSDVDETTLRAAYSLSLETRVFGPYTGALSNGGETLTLNDKNGVVMTTLSYRDDGKWPIGPDGTGHTLTRINPNLKEGEWRNWTSSINPGGSPGRGRPTDEELPTSTTRVAEKTSVWSFDQNTGNADLGTAWRELVYDDSGWAIGPGIFGRNSADVFGTPWTTGGRFTYYMRKEFEWNTAFSSATIDVNGHVDDGVVLYLNGQEIGRFNMPGGAIAFDTPASSSREWGTEVELASESDITGALINGTNVLAVEVHNQSAGSSDIVFGADFDITAAELPAEALPTVAISEIHFGDDGRVDWVELHAPGTASVSATALSVASLSDLSDSTALSGNIPGGGYMSFDVDFPVEANGNVAIYVAKGATVLDAHRFDRDLGEESFQSLPVGEEFYGGPGHTQDAANNPTSRNTDIVINEIMFDAPSDHTNVEFIELFNRGASTVDLSGWAFTAGVSFTFPSGTTIAPGAFLVVAADAECLTSAHGAIPVIGDWSGRLSDSGELLRLEDANQNLADEVDYLPEGDWPNMADGDGASMELRHPDMDNAIATAWADSDESNKSTMQSFVYTAPFERATWSPATSGKELHAHLVGDAHLIIENVSVKLNNSGSNLVVNPSVMSPDNISSKGWVCQGTHWASFMDNGALNLISDGHGDNKANRAEVDLGNMVFDQSYTLSFDARWVSGKPRLIVQTQDHGFGSTFLLPIPENLGTPGAVNSATLASAAPTVTGVIHSPAVPGPNTPVKVSARVGASAALSSVEVVHRLDNSSGNAPWSRTAMTDDGTGLYSATLTDYASQGDIVQFYVDAKSGAQSTFQPRFGPDRPAMWIVDGRDMPDVLLRERFVVSEFDRAALNTAIGHSPTFAYNFPRMSNHFFNCTFIANESEIFYNGEIRKSGSPFTRSTNANIDHGKWKLPGDRLFRGRRRSVIDASGTAEGSGTPRFYDDRIARYFMYQLGHPINEMEFVHSVVNTLPFKLRENHEPISNDFLNRNFEDGSDGTLMRIDDEWRFTSDNGDSRSSRNADWSYKNSDNPVRYHSEWILRTRESDYDYSSFIEWVRTLDENTFDESEIRRLANVEMLCLNAAVRGYDADWDTITVNRGKNAYFYRPKEKGQFGSGWMLMHWDGDRVFDRSTQAILGSRTGVPTFFNKPYVRRHLNYYLTKLLDDHTKGSARTVAWMDAEVDAVAGSGITMTKSHYVNWFNIRETLARNFVTAAVNNTSFVITTNNAATTSATIDLGGTAPPDVFAVQVVGQEEASFSWVDTTSWVLEGLVLKAGVNTFDVIGVDHDGNVAETAQFQITKTTDAPPVVDVVTSPKSKNVSLGELLDLDASESFDPEGGSLTFTWSVSPTSGVDLVPAGATATASFAQPGIYQFTVTATDSELQNTSMGVGVAVYGPGGFSSFGTTALSDVWSLVNIDKHGNSTWAPHFSLEDNAGRLSINLPIPGQAAPTSFLPFIGYADTWKYNQSGADLSATFHDPSFDDSSWAIGDGYFGFGGISAGPPAPGFQTTLTNGELAYYFRKEFEFSGETVGSKINIDQLVDDGVVYYLNGQEISRIRMPAGVISGATPAESNGPEQVEDDVVAASISGILVEGTNVFAAEVHNRSSGSSDLVFGVDVSIAEGSGAPLPSDARPAWVQRALPDGDWTMQTEVKLEKAQFGNFLAGLLIEGVESGAPVRYGIAFDGGDSVSALRGGVSGVPTSLATVPSGPDSLVAIRLQRVGDQLLFSWDDGIGFSQFHLATLPANTTFSVGGIFVSTPEDELSVEASFDYLMLIDSTPASAEALVVSEIMYKPAEAGSSEFIELYNAGATPIDLAGFSTVADEPFGSFTFPVFTLQPGAYALLVQDTAAFTATYGAALAPQIIGQWTGGALGNGGDTITITDATGALVTSFTYDDNLPWPEAADGSGASLVINDENGDLVPGDGTNWHASAIAGGSPGSAEQAVEDFDTWMANNGFADPNAEYADTGLSNLLAYALGRDLSDQVAPMPGEDGGFATFAFRQRVGSDALLYEVESSSDGENWSPAADLVEGGAAVDNGDGTQTVTMTSNVATAGRAKILYRLRVSAPVQ